MLPAKLPSKQLQVIWYSVINSIIHQWWSGKCYCLLPKYLYLTCTWLKKYLMYLMSSKYSEYLNLYLYLQIWKSTCTWLKYFEKYLTPTLVQICLGGWLLTVYSDIVNTFKLSYLHGILSITIIETPECQHCIVWQWAAFWARGNGKFPTIKQRKFDLNLSGK